MKPSLWHRLDLWARRLTPFALSVLLVVLNVVPLHVPGLTRVVPVLGLIAVHHWTLYRPELLPLVAVFLLGLLQDVMSGMPIGVNALVFLTVHAVILFQRRFFFGKSFAVTWLGFVVMAAGAAAQSWILVSAFYVALIDARSLVYQYLLTVGFFPVFAWLFLRWDQAFLKAE